MIALPQIFNYEGVLAQGIADALDATERELTILTINDAPKFQKERARIEVTFEAGGANGKLYNGAGLGARPGETFEEQFKGKASISVITQSTEAEHAEYRAFIRWMCGTMITRANAELDYHALLWFSAAGTGELEHDPAKGYFRTILEYDVEFSIIPQAMTDFLAQTN